MRYISEHFRRDGRPKVSYASRDVAVRAMGKNRDIAYPCKFCGAWHRAKDKRNDGRTRITA